MRVAVVTCSHRGDDARIAHRQIRALLDAGHSVTLVAPDPTPFAHPGFEHVLVPRSVGRRRLGAWRAVRRAVGPLRPDLVLVHDIELLPVIPRSVRCPLVWDVHEDYVAAASDRAWLPSWARGAASLAARVGPIELRSVGVCSQVNTHVVTDRSLVPLAECALRPGGLLAIEHADDQGEQAREAGVPELLRQRGFVDVVDHHDLAGRPRFTTAVVGETSDPAPGGC